MENKGACVHTLQIPNPTENQHLHGWLGKGANVEVAWFARPFVAESAGEQ